VAGDVTDDQGEVAAGEREGVVPVAGDFGGVAGGLVVAGKFQAR
jgi:hypothetical protein